MEVHAMVMVMAVLLTRGLVAEEEAGREEKRGSRRQCKRTCSWTLWRCNRAPRGWRLFQLVFPWFIALVICMPCLGVAGHGVFTKGGGTLQSSLHFFADGLLVRNQEARPVTCHPVTSDHKDSITEPSRSFEKAKPSEADHVRSSEPGMLPDLLAEEELVLASCMLPGWSYVQEALLSTTSQAEASVEIIIQASRVQEQGVVASLDWGSKSLTSVSVKFLTLVNSQPNKELKVFRILTTNAQFCTVDFQETVVSPSSRLSIPIAYVVNSLDKTEGRMLLQTNSGRYIVRTTGEGIPLLYPLLGFMGTSKLESWEMGFFFNSFDESVTVEEAFVWVESINGDSTSHQAKGEGRVLCKRYDPEPKSSNSSWLKVRPRAEWFLAPHSSTPIMDLSIKVDDWQHLVGTLCFKIFQHSVQLFEVLVVHMEMECDSLGTSNAMLFPKKNLAEVVPVFLKTETESGWARLLQKSYFLPLQVENAFINSQSHNGLITISVGNLPMGVRVKSLIADTSWICFSGKSSLACKLSCLADFASVKELINNTIHLTVPDLCSGLLLFGASRGNIVDEDRFSENLLNCTRHVFCQKYIDVPSATCNADAMVNDLLNKKNVYGPKFLHAHHLDGRCMSWENHIYMLALVTHSKLWSDASDLTANLENLRNTFFTLLFSADLMELAKLGNIQDNDFTYLFKKLISDGFAKQSPFYGNPKSVCAWPRIVIESNTYARILDSSSVSMISSTSYGSRLRSCLGTLKQRDCLLSRDRESNILYTMQESDLKEGQKLDCIAAYRMELVDLADCGSEYTRLFFCCKSLLSFMDLFESDFLKESVAEDCFEGCCVPMKSFLAVLFPPIYRVSLPVSRHQKLVLKFSLLILFSVFVMLIKVVRRERQLALDYSSHTLFFQSVCLKTGYIKASESSSSFEHAAERINNASSLKRQNGEFYENRFLAVMAGVFGSLGSMFRSVFDLQATVLNIRVQISESPPAISTEQDPNYSKSGLMADQTGCSMGLNNLEKSGSHQVFTTMQDIPGNSCRESTDTLRGTHHEAAGALLSVSAATTVSTTEDVSPIRSVSDLEKVQHKEKREKGKRRRKRSNIIDLKQELEMTGQSCSSSPPSSPASPATPLANSPISIFRQSDLPIRSLQGSMNSRGQSSNSSRDPIPRSTLVQFSSEMLSQLEVRADHTCNSANKGRSHHLYTLGSKGSLEPLPMRPTTAVKTEIYGKGSVRADTRKDASVGENWAAVARRAIGSPSEEDQCQRLSRSSRCLKNGGTQKKPVLLPSATFPQSGRSMQWNPQKLEERSFTLNDPRSSPSLISTSLVAPDARAPGSRPHINEKLPTNNHLEAAEGQLEVGSTVSSTAVRMYEGCKTDTFLYDIWGDHFAEINRSTQADLISAVAIHEHDMVEITSSASPKVGSLLAGSELMSAAFTPGNADASVGHSIFIPPAAFSVFSYDTFFPPYQCKDAAGSPTP